MFASVVSEEKTDLLGRIGAVQSSLAQVSQGEMGEEKVAAIRQVVKGMFPKESANLTKVQAWKDSMQDSKYAESLLSLIEATHNVAQASGENDPPSLVQTALDPQGKLTFGDVIPAINMGLKEVGKSVKEVGQFVATTGGNMEAIGAGKKDMDWRVIALLNPNLLCFFTDMSFLPCVGFDICMGVAMEVTTLPTWWAKQSWQLLTVPGNLYGSLKSMKDATTICSVVNMVVASQMPPVAQGIKNVKAKKEFRKKQIKGGLDLVGKSLKGVFAKITPKKKDEDKE